MRPQPTDLLSQLGYGAAETQTTLDLYLTDTSEFHFSTQAFTGTNSEVYTADLRKVSELKQSLDKSTDRVTALIQNVDKVFGAEVLTGSLAKAVAVVGRQYGNPFLTDAIWVELFRGEARALSVDENEISLEVVNDLLAAGFCVSHWSLAENCQFVYKHAVTCGYAGAMTTCNKRRKSPDGCSGHIVSGSTTNEYRFGGMEFPDAQAASVPIGGGGVDEPPGWLPCPRLDQWTLVRGNMGATPVAKPVGKLTLRDRLFDPTTGTFNPIESLDIVRDHPMMQLVTDSLATSFNSGSHRVIRSKKDDRGTPCEDLHIGYSALTWSNGELHETSIEKVGFTGDRGDVMKIKLKGRHIYCSGHTPKAFVVAHNSKEPPID